MKKIMMLLLGSLLVVGHLHAQAPVTKRIEQFSNGRVTVWKTVVYPTTSQALTMHRHEHDRVVVALTDGSLKITNNHGKVHYFKLEKDKAYYLTKDVPNELHNDVNMTNHPIKVMVIELNDQDQTKHS